MRTKRTTSSVSNSLGASYRIQVAKIKGVGVYFKKWVHVALFFEIINSVAVQV